MIEINLFIFFSFEILYLVNKYMNYKEYNIMKNINCVQFIFTHTIENLKFYEIIKVILLILIYFYLDFDELFEYLNLKTTYFFQFIIQQ